MGIGFSWAKLMESIHLCVISKANTVFKGFLSLRVGWEFWSHLLSLPLTSKKSDRKWVTLLFCWRRQMLEILKLAVWLHENLSVSFTGQRWHLPRLFWRVALAILTSLLPSYARLGKGGRWGSAQPWVLFNSLADEERAQDLPQHRTSPALTLWGTLDL